MGSPCRVDGGAWRRLRVHEAVTEVTGAPATYLLVFGENFPHFHAMIAARGDDVPPERRSGEILKLRRDRADFEAACTLVDPVRKVYDRIAEQGLHPEPALVEQHPDRFGAFAALPGDSPEAMLDELEYALDALQLDGVLLTSNVNGIYLGMDWYEPVLAELNRRQVPVLLHPTDSPAIVGEFGFGRPSSVCEFTFDTARTVINGIYRGVFQRYPDLRLILAHCGGPLPALGWRVAEHTVMGTGPDDADIRPAHVTDVLSNLYYETALAGAPHSLLPTLQVANAEHILFGTDWPAAPESTVIHNTTNLVNSGALSEEQLRGVLSRNAKSLFPRLA